MHASFENVEGTFSSEEGGTFSNHVTRRGHVFIATMRFHQQLGYHNAENREKRQSEKSMKSASVGYSSMTTCGL